MAEYDPATEQPPPVRTDGRDIQSLVMADIAARRDVGTQRYGTALQAHNGRDALRDAYDEALDLACYLRQLIEESGGVRVAIAHGMVWVDLGRPCPVNRCDRTEAHQHGVDRSWTRDG